MRPVWEARRSAWAAAAGPRSRAEVGAGLADRLRSGGASFDEAVRELQVLMLRAAWHQVARTPGVYAKLGARRVEDAVAAAADEATMAVLSRLDTFEGRSRFTTWAFKFGILHAAVELRRASWRHVEIDLVALGDQVSTMTSPEHHAEGGDLERAVRAAIDSALTAHQRAVMTALLLENVPMDVLVERLGSTRNALYKTLHDARKRVRADLTRRGYLTDSTINEEVIP